MDEPPPALQEPAAFSLSSFSSPALQVRTVQLLEAVLVLFKNGRNRKVEFSCCTNFYTYFFPKKVRNGVA
jgi:hypothetical protein